jgi:glucose-6-phosphate 1-dehydrogenase
VLRAIRVPKPEEDRQTLVLGQYEGYRAEPQVAEDSATETFAALRLFVDTERWRGVPFYIPPASACAAVEML